MARSSSSRALGGTASALGLLMAALGAATGCTPSSSGAAPARSPAYDYQPPAPATADGDVVGADRRSPGDTMAEGATTAGPAPGWSVEDGKLRHDPKDRVGGAVENKSDDDRDVAVPPSRSE